jgi:hypothetical protein
MWEIILGGTPDAERLLLKPSYRGEDSIKIDLQEVGLEYGLD